MEQIRDLIKKPQSLVDLIEYQKDSVVSKALISKSTGNVTLFAFDEGQGLSEHTSPYDALIMVLDGELNVTVAGELHQPISGEVLLMPANKPHALHAKKRAKMLLIMIHE